MIITGDYDANVLHLAGATFTRRNDDGTTYVEPETFNPGGIPAAALQIAKARKAWWLRAAAKAANEAGFTSTALDGVTDYKYSTDNAFGDSSFDGIDMLFLNSVYAAAVRNVSVPGWTILFPAKGQSDLSYKAYSHTAAQMIQVGETGLSFIQGNRTNLRTKLVQVATATTITEVNSIVW